MNSKAIREICYSIIEATGDFHEKHAEFSKRHPRFAKDYPVLFEMCCQPAIDKQRLEYMLGLLFKIEKKEMTQHDASVEVGQSLFNVYVKDKIKIDQ